MGALSERQQREIDYHRGRAAEYAHLAAKPPYLYPVTAPRWCFKWWNAYWVMLRKADRLDLLGKRVLVIGCGFGDDTLQLAYFGAAISAIDISAETVEIARDRAEASAVPADFAIAPAEQLPYADQTFDLVYLPDVVHHLDIGAAVREVRRVLKPGGAVLGNEPYTHSWLQAIRQSRLVRERIYPRMLRRIYQTDKPYITADERKLDQRGLRQIDEILPITDRQYFLLVLGRLTRWQYQAIIDRLILKLPFAGHFLAGRVVFSGRRISR
jgi:ubiquinone/menaquinone biosynthesis C-methylase UbiE